MINFSPCCLKLGVLSTFIIIYRQVIAGEFTEILNSSVKHLFPCTNIKMKANYYFLKQIIIVTISDGLIGLLFSLNVTKINILTHILTFLILCLVPKIPLIVMQTFR